MFTNLVNSVKSAIRPVDIHLVLCVVMLALFVLGAGAPSAFGF